MSIGPPNDVGPRDTTPEGADTTSFLAPIKTSSRSQSNGARRQCGRYAHAWRHGFAAGFKDGLRLAAREFDDPHAWLVLDRIADQYELAADD